MPTKLSSSDLLAQLERTQRSALQIRNLSDGARQAILRDLATATRAAVFPILDANRADVAAMDPADPKRDRLLLNEARIEALATSILDVASLPDPTGRILAEHRLDNGLHIQKISVPLGVVGVIYESRPNVTLDVGALCLRSGNAAVLRGGSDAWQTNRVLVALMQDVLAQHGLNRDVVALLPPDRELAHALLQANRFVDVLIPRGSEGLIRFVRENARIPVIETGAGVCHTYVHALADLEKARAIVVNAKVSRPAVCNALDTVLVDSAVASRFLPLLCPEFQQWKVAVYADAESYAVLQAAGYERLFPATEEDFGRSWWRRTGTRNTIFTWRVCPCSPAGSTGFRSRPIRSSVSLWGCWSSRCCCTCAMSRASSRPWSVPRWRASGVSDSSVGWRDPSSPC